MHSINMNEVYAKECYYAQELMSLLQEALCIRLPLYSVDLKIEKYSVDLKIEKSFLCTNRIALDVR